MTVRSPALAAVAAAALLAAGCGGEEEASPEVAWADGVCTSVSTWLESVESAARSLQEDGAVEERVDAALEEVRSATDELEDDVRGLEPPEGARTESVDELLDDLSDGLDTIEEAVGAASDPGDVVAALAAVGTTVQEMSGAVASTVDELRRSDDPTLAEAFDEADSCRELRERS